MTKKKPNNSKTPRAWLTCLRISNEGGAEGLSLCELTRDSFQRGDPEKKGGSCFTLPTYPAKPPVYRYFLATADLDSYLTLELVNFESPLGTPRLQQKVSRSYLPHPTPPPRSVSLLLALPEFGFGSHSLRIWTGVSGFVETSSRVLAWVDQRLVPYSQ